MDIPYTFVEHSLRDAIVKGEASLNVREGSVILGITGTRKDDLILHTSNRVTDQGRARKLLVGKPGGLLNNLQNYTYAGTAILGDKTLHIYLEN